VFVNIAGGMSIDEPAVDLAIVASVASSMRNRPITPRTAVFGEVGLGGEVRGVAQANLRIREAEQMGFTRIVLPIANMAAELAEPGGSAPPGSEETGKADLVGVRTVGEALDMLLA
jgi:DNA repair protein RadA/Sms